jgi:hypothetical protein
VNRTLRYPRMLRDPSHGQSSRSLLTHHLRSFCLFLSRSIIWAHFQCVGPACPKCL